MTKEEKIKEVMELVDKLWDFSASRCAPSLQAKQRDAIESKLRELIQEGENNA